MTPNYFNSSAWYTCSPLIWTQRAILFFEKTTTSDLKGAKHFPSHFTLRSKKLNCTSEVTGWWSQKDSTICNLQGWHDNVPEVEFFHNTAAIHFPSHKSQEGIGDKASPWSVLNRLDLTPGNKIQLSLRYTKTRRTWIIGYGIQYSHITIQKIPSVAQYPFDQYPRWWGHKTASSCCFFRLCSDRLWGLFQRQAPGVQLGYKLHSPTWLHDRVPISPLDCHNSWI